MPMMVMPICTVDKKVLGDLASARAAAALELPALAADSSRALRADTKAISDIEKRPLSKMSPKRIRISIKIILLKARAFYVICGADGRV